MPTPAQLQTMRVMALTGAAFVPLFLYGSLYWAGLPREDEKRVVRCGSDVQGRGTALLALSEAQCRAVAAAIPTVNPEVPAASDVTTTEGFRTPVKIGERPPAGVETLAMPAQVAEKFPDLARYRYFLAGDDIALVRPRDGEVVAFIEVHDSPR